jgi:hypothetical protein
MRTTLLNWIELASYPSNENCAHKVRKIRRTLCVYFLPFRRRTG